MYDQQALPPSGSHRLLLVAALIAAIVGVGAFGAAVVAGAQQSTTGRAMPFVSTATPSTVTGWAGGPHGAGGSMGPRGGNPGGGMMPGAITISGISGTQLSLKTADGWTRTIDASGATVTSGGQTIALSSLQPGDQITFRETRQSDGTYTINSIDVVLPHVSGTVSSVGASSVTVKQLDGTTKTINLTGSTTFRLAGKTSTVSALVSGVRVDIQGTVASDGTFSATNVDIAPATIAGTVSAKSGSSLTVKDRAGTSVTVNVTASTTYWVSGVPNAGLGDVAVGDVIQAQGTLNADGSLTATAVRVGAPGQPGYAPMGGGPAMRGSWGSNGSGGFGPFGASPNGGPGGFGPFGASPNGGPGGGPGASGGASGA